MIKEFTSISVLQSLHAINLIKTKNRTTKHKTKLNKNTKSSLFSPQCQLS